MNVLLVRSRARSLVALVAATCALALARPAHALSLADDASASIDEQLSLLDEPLSLADRPAPPSLRVALADDAKPTDGRSSGAAPSAPSLDFDLLGKPPPTVQVDDAAMHRRRAMLKWHQGLGIGLYALEVATTVVGQLNYSDKFGSNAPNTAKYKETHKILAYSTLGVFAVNGTLAILAPTPKGKVKKGFDRVSLHKLGMAIATAGMLAQAGTGIYTASREGYLNQQDIAKTHLIIGYATFAAMTVAVGALVF